MYDYDCEVLCMLCIRSIGGVARDVYILLKCCLYFMNLVFELKAVYFHNW